MLSGGVKSLAASLDYALTKQPGWLLDMFGVSSNGKTQARRLFRVTNSHRKRGGPVSISLNSNACPSDCIEIVVDGKSITCPHKVRILLENIEAYEVPSKSLRSDDDGGSGEGVLERSLAAWELITELEAA
jgi:hypothetical protein